MQEARQMCNAGLTRCRCPHHGVDGRNAGFTHCRCPHHGWWPQRAFDSLQVHASWGRLPQRGFDTLPAPAQCGHVATDHMKGLGELTLEAQRGAGLGTNCESLLALRQGREAVSGAEAFERTLRLGVRAVWLTPMTSIGAYARGAPR